MFIIGEALSLILFAGLRNQEPTAFYLVVAKLSDIKRAIASHYHAEALSFLALELSEVFFLFGL